ncbi:MAG TPA: YlbF family regulator [Clostridia bacterium]|nr:YlbF family regulator [Clostridia bacterium]
MEKILEKARELGRLIAQSEEFTNLNALDEQMYQDPEVSGMLERYADLRDRIAAAEAGDEAPEQDLKALRDQADGLQVSIARLTFNRMMERVNRALQAQLTGEDEFAEDLGCSGGCAGCSGCGSPR